MVPGIVLDKYDCDSMTESNGSMPTTILISELHSAYHGVSKEEAIAMANLGAICYDAVKGGLYEQWSATMTGEDSAKAEAWRQEGRCAVLESVRAKLVAAEDAIARASAAEGLVQQLRSSVEAETARRVKESLDSYRKDYELATMAEISAMKERVALSEGKGEYIHMLAEAHAVMREKIVDMDKRCQSLQAQLLESTQVNTKSSHMIGKQGEATVLEMLEDTVMNAFPYSEVKDMTAIHHAADFHLWVMKQTGGRIKILVDSKKYSQPVNSSEVSKLNKDVDADEEAQCGMLISLVSPIAAKKQFQIKNTPKQKPIIYLTFMDMESDLQKEVVCWAIHALLAVVGETDQGARNQLLENIDQFLEGINSSVKELDGVIRMQIKTLESTRQVRSGIIHKVSSFREGKQEDCDTIEHEEDGGCTTIRKASGDRCGKLTISGTEKCRNHAPRKDKSANSKGGGEGQVGK